MLFSAEATNDAIKLFVSIVSDLENPSVRRTEYSKECLKELAILVQWIMKKDSTFSFPEPPEYYEKLAKY
jgi:hypothetical protein